jgi:SH3 domain protein
MESTRVVMKHFQYFCVFGLAMLAITAEAQTRYVSDELVITLRTGPSNQNSITRNLTSGARVEVIEENDEGNYTHVRLADGVDGWVLTQYLQDEQTASLRLATATRELADASRRAADFEDQATQLAEELAAAREALAQSQTYAEQVDSQLSDVRSASASAIETREQNERLANRVSNLTAAADLADMEIRELRSRNRQSWFIVGASVLFGGIVIGLVAPSLRRKRRSSW